MMKLQEVAGVGGGEEMPNKTREKKLSRIIRKRREWLNVRRISGALL